MPKHWNHSQFAELYNAIVSNKQDQISQGLQLLKDDLEGLTVHPPKSGVSRQKVESGKVLFSTEEEYELNKDFIAEALNLSEEMNLDEVVSCEVLYNASQSSLNTVGATLAESGEAVLYLRRQYILFIVSYLCNACEEPIASFETIFQSFKQVEQELEDVKQLVQRSRILDNYSNLAFQQGVSTRRRFLFKEHQTLGDILTGQFSINATSSQFTSVLNHVSSFPPQDSFIVHYVPGLLKYCEKLMRVSDAEMVALHSLFAENATDDCPVKAAVGFAFFVFFIEWCKHSEDRRIKYEFQSCVYEPLLRLVEANALEQIMCLAASEEPILYHYRTLLQCHVPQFIDSRLESNLWSSGPLPFLQKSLATLSIRVIEDCRFLLTHLRNLEEDLVLSSEKFTLVAKSADLERFYMTVFYLCNNHKEMCDFFWEKKSSVVEFLEWGSASNSSLMVSTFCVMLSSFASVHPVDVFNFLQSNADISLTPRVNWSSIYDMLAGSDVLIVSGIAHLIAQVATHSETTRLELLTHNEQHLLKLTESLLKKDIIAPALYILSSLKPSSQVWSIVDHWVYGSYATVGHRTKQALCMALKGPVDTLAFVLLVRGDDSHPQYVEFILEHVLPSVDDSIKLPILDIFAQSLAKDDPCALRCAESPKVRSALFHTASLGLDAITGKEAESMSVALTEKALKCLDLATGKVRSFADAFLLELPLVAHLGLYAGSEHVKVATNALSLLYKLSQTHQFASRLVTVFSTVDDSVRIRHGFAEQLGSSFDGAETMDLKVLLLDFLDKNLQTGLAQLLLGIKDDFFLLSEMISLLKSLEKLDFPSQRIRSAILHVLLSVSRDLSVQRVFKEQNLFQTLLHGISEYPSFPHQSFTDETMGPLIFSTKSRALSLQLLTLSGLKTLPQDSSSVLSLLLDVLQVNFPNSSVPAIPSEFSNYNFDKIGEVPFTFADENCIYNLSKVDEPLRPYVKGKLALYQFQAEQLECIRAWSTLVQLTAPQNILLDLLHATLLKTDFYLDFNITFAQELVSLCVFLYNRCEKDLIKDVSTAGRLFLLFKTCINGICAPLASSDLRADLYVLCSRYLNLFSKNTKVVSELLVWIRSSGSRLLQNLCSDSISGDGSSRITSLLLFETLIKCSSLFEKDQIRSNFIVDYMAKNAYLSSLTASLLRPDEVLVACSSDEISSKQGISMDTLLYELTAFKATISFMLRIAQTKSGAQRLLQAGLVNTLEACLLLHVDPDLGIELRFIESPHLLKTVTLFMDSFSSKSVSYFEVLLPVFQLITAIILSVGASNKRSIEMLRLLLQNFEPLILGVLKRDSVMEREGKARSAELNELTKLFVLLYSLL